MKRHRARLGHKQHTVRLLKTKKSVKIRVNPWLILILTNYGTRAYKKINPGNSAQFKQFGAPFSAISRTIRDNSRVIGANSRQLALWLTPSLNPAHLAKNAPKTTLQPPPIF